MGICISKKKNTAEELLKMKYTPTQYAAIYLEIDPEMGLKVYVGFF